jgi:hypothetical protein
MHLTGKDKHRLKMNGLKKIFKQMEHESKQEKVHSYLTKQTLNQS